MNEIQSLARGLKILDILGQNPDGISITELSERLNVDKGSASRLVSTLAAYGYAERDEVTRRYHVGSQIVSLSRSVLNRLPLREAAKPFLRQLMERTGECAHLGVATQGKVMYIDQVESPVTLRVNAQVGTMNPLYCTALGKILLAFGDLDLPAEMPAFTEKTITVRSRNTSSRYAAWAMPWTTRNSTLASAASLCPSSISATSWLARSVFPARPPESRWPACLK
jgi:IclR family KDG regulon transcriptional repressor